MFKKALAAAFITVLSTQAQSAIMSLSGLNYDVQYDDAQAGRTVYGTPALSGGVVYFTPTTLRAESLNGQGMMMTNVGFTFTILPKSGFVVSNIALQERGDYILRGAASTVRIAGSTRAVTSNGPLVDVSSAITSASDLSIADGIQHDWTAVSSLNLAASGLKPGQNITYTIESILEATTSAAATGARRAFVEEKFSGFEISVNSVPLPTTLLLFFLGLGAMVTTRAKRFSFNLWPAASLPASL